MNACLKNNAEIDIAILIRNQSINWSDIIPESFLNPTDAQLAGVDWFLNTGLYASGVNFTDKEPESK